jgi:tRNA (guanine26-N2/guanine27-N2)-dimethyltransferase
MQQEITEGSTSFVTDSDENITADMPVFYNPVMKRNRDLTLLVLLAMQKEREERKEERGLRISLPMEASGVRAARILHELSGKGLIKIERLLVNDRDATAVACATQNVDKYRGALSAEQVTVSQSDANLFLRSTPHADYIDIDPFGTPCPFLDSAVRAVATDGILAVTATDTSALAGTYPHATARKYWAVPTRTWMMHEAGLRILIRKIQLIAAQHDIAMLPVMSVSTDHYYRVFFRCAPGTGKVKAMLSKHAWLHVCTACMTLNTSSLNSGSCSGCGATVQAGTPAHAAGPLWTGPLHDAAFVRRVQVAVPVIDELSHVAYLDKQLAATEEECTLDRAADDRQATESKPAAKCVVGFLDIHELASRQRRNAPSMETALLALGVSGSRTHICGHGIKTDLPVAEVIRRLWPAPAPTTESHE